MLPNSGTAQGASVPNGLMAANAKVHGLVLVTRITADVAWRTRCGACGSSARSVRQFIETDDAAASGVGEPACS